MAFGYCIEEAQKASAVDGKPVELTEEDLANGMVMGPDGFVYAPPPASKQLNIDMQVSVTACTTWREVLDTVERNGDLFDYRNTATAIHRVARFGNEESDLVRLHPTFPRLLLLLRAKTKLLTARAISDAVWGCAKLGVRDDVIFGKLSARAVQIRHEMDPQGLALVAWGFGTAGRRDDELFSALADAARRKIHEFGPQNIANLSWATATLGFKCDPLHEDIVAASLRNLDSFTSQELAMVNWALTKVAFPCSNAWRAAFRKRVMQLKEYAPSELSMLAWALATRGDYDPELMSYIARRSMEAMRGFSGQNLATIIWALGTVSYKDDPCIDEFLRMALGAIIARAGEFQPLNISLISWGLAKIAYRAEVAFEALCESALNQIDQFVPQNLVQILWACATAGFRDDKFLRGASRVAKRTMQDFSSQHLSNFIWACARLSFKEDVELLRLFSTESVRKMNEGSPQHLSNIAWAVSQLGPEHFQDCLASVVEVTTRRLNEFDPPSLMMLSDSLYEAKYVQNERLLGILRDHVFQMGRELVSIYTDGLPTHRGASSPMAIAEYQRRLRAVGLVTFGYEHTNTLFSQLRLAEGPVFAAEEAFAMPGWTTNARRTTCARRHSFRVGSEVYEDRGTIFTSAFASVADDNSCDFIVTWLGQGKADSPTVGRAGRSGDAECRALVDTHHILKQAAHESSNVAVSGWVSFHTSGVPCLSCVGIAAQFKALYPNVTVNFTFSARDNSWESPELNVSSQTPRSVPRAVGNDNGNLGGDARSTSGAYSINGGYH